MERGNLWALIGPGEPKHEIMKYVFREKQSSWQTDKQWLILHQNGLKIDFMESEDEPHKYPSLIMDNVLFSMHIHFPWTDNANL